MGLRFAICDDDTSDSNKLKDCLLRYQMNRNIDFTVDIYNSGEELLKNYSSPYDYNAILLDIEMPKVNGIELATTIKNYIDRHSVIVFVSSYPKYMQSSFSVHPYHFITKPYNDDEIYKVIDDILKDIETNTNYYTIVDCDEYEETVNVKDILYFESTDSKKQLLNIHLINKTLESKGTISSWEKMLSDKGFIVCYRGYLVNLTHIHYLKKNKIVLDNGDIIPISRDLRNKMSDIYMNQFFS